MVVGKRRSEVKRSMSRRGFVQKTSLGLSSALLASSSAILSCDESEPPVAEKPEREPVASAYGSFLMAFQSYSLRNFTALDEFIAQAGKLELPYVELWRGHLSTSASEEEISTMKSRLKQIGIEPIAFGVEQFTADHDQNRALFEFGRTLGIRNFSANPTKDAFSSLEKLVKEYDIRIAIHNHGPEDERWRRPEWILEAVEDLDPRIGACADLGHFIRADVDPVEAVEMLDSRVLGVHFKDFDADGNDVVIGQGRLDVEASLRALKRVNFEGPLSLEFEGDRENPVPKMLESLEEIRKAVNSL